jgi:hypothetical protein
MRFPSPLVGKYLSIPILCIGLRYDNDNNDDYDKDDAEDNDGDDDDNDDNLNDLNYCYCVSII